jgi:hypothetical protein
MRNLVDAARTLGFDEVVEAYVPDTERSPGSSPDGPSGTVAK